MIPTMPTSRTQSFASFITGVLKQFDGQRGKYFEQDIHNIHLASLITNSRVLKHDPLNRSDHLPLSTTFSLSYVSTNSNNSTSHPKVNWRRATKDGSLLTYQAKVRDMITPLLNKEYTCCADLDEEICFVSEKLSQIALSTLPSCQPKKRKKHFVNNKELQERSIYAKMAWKRWRNAGRPRSGPLFK